MNLDGFVTKEQDWGGLYNLADSLEKKNLREERQRERDEADRFAATKFLSNYFDPKEHLTGSPLDKQTNVLLSDAYNQALDMVRNKVPVDQILFATQPLVNKVNDYTANAKAYQEQKKQALLNAKGIKGIDVNLLGNTMDNFAFPIDPITGQRDISQFDPTANYADRAFKEGNIYTNEAFDDYVSKSGKNTITEGIKVINPKGGMRSTKAEMTMPAFMQKEEGANGEFLGFVPKYEIATDGDNKLIHSFGEQGDHPVRMVTDEVFGSLKPEQLAYIRQEVKKHTDEAGVPLSSQQAHNLAKAIAYDELKNSGKNYSTFKELQVEKANPIDKWFSHYNYALAHPKPSAQSDTSNINDVYSGIYNAFDNPETVFLIDKKTGEKYGIMFNQLDSDAQNVVTDFVNKNRNIKVEPEEIFVNREDGKLKVYRVNEKGQPIPDKNKGSNLLGVLPYTGTNLKVQPSVKEKRNVLEKAKSLFKAPKSKQSTTGDPLGIL